jgi:hypothetical protein
MLGGVQSWALLKEQKTDEHKANPRRIFLSISNLLSIKKDQSLQDIKFIECPLSFAKPKGQVV